MHASILTVAGASTLMPGMCGVPDFQTVGMLGGHLRPPPGRHAHHQRHTELSSRHVPDGRGVVDDLIERQQAEIDRHDLDDGAHPAQSRADAGPDEGRFRQRRIADALGAKFLERPLLQAYEPAVATDVFSHQKDARRSLLQGISQAARIGITVGSLVSMAILGV